MSAGAGGDSDLVVLEGEPANCKAGYITKAFEYYRNTKPVTKQASHSRKRSLDEDQISRSSQFSVIQTQNLRLPEKWITVANVHLSSEIPMKIVLSPILEEIMGDLEEIELEITRCNLKYTSRKTFEVVASFGQLKPLFEIQIEDSDASLVETHCRFLKATVQSRRTDFHDVKKPILRLTLKKSHINNQALLTYKLDYKIFARESILHPYPVDAIRKMRLLAGFIFEDDLTTYQKGTCDTRELENRFSTPSEAMFYDLITSNTEKNIHKKDSKAFDLPRLNKRLLGFQKETLDWMLDHEGVKLSEDGSAVSPIPFYRCKPDDGELTILNNISKCLDNISFGWSRVRHKSLGQYYWYNLYTGNICSNEMAIEFFSQVPAPPAQALLAEEMGLGKTIEVISLILSHPRTTVKEHDSPKDDYFNNRPVMESKTTLIICPESILGQWKQEIEDVDSGLKVIVYNGIYNYEKTAESRSMILSPTQIAKKLSEYDVVLVSYGVASREVHRATYNPATRPSRACTSRIKFPMFEDSEKQYDPLEYEKQRKRRRVTEDDDPLLLAEEEDESGTYRKRDYSSPLMLLEFWRVVLDEVQMTSSISTNASKIARMIPRVHAWGVSGTLIKKDLGDLFSLLSFLRLYPVDIFSAVSQDSVWKSIITERPLYKFIRLFKGICLRHTKKMVAEQIKIPPQVRVMLRTPFTPIERDNYDHLLNSFLSQVGLNERGEPLDEDWDPSRAYTYMRSWLTRLRRLCCHAQIGSGASRKRQGNNNDEHEIGTLVDVLSDITEAAKDEIFTSERAIVNAYIKKGKIYEFRREPDLALKVFELAIEETLKRLAAAESDKSITEVKRTSRIRSWYELLYQAYFLGASAHYQHYRPMSPMPETFPEYEYKEQQDVDEAEEEEELPEEIDVETLTPEERIHNAKENEYYALADDVITKMLDEPNKKVDEMVSKLSQRLDKLEMYTVTDTVFKYTEVTKKGEQIPKVYEISKEPLIRVLPPVGKLEGAQESYLYSHKLRAHFRLFESTSNLLNRQAAVINHWVTESTKLLKKPVSNEEGQDLTGGEYGTALKDQSLLYMLLELISRILDEREVALVAVESSAVVRMSKAIPTAGFYEDSATDEIYKTLELVKNSILNLGAFEPETSLRSLVKDARELEADSKRFQNGDGMFSADYEFISDMHNLLKTEMKEQEKALQFARKTIYELMNDTFNSKIEYYRSLQRKSDSVKKYKPVVSYLEPHITPKSRSNFDLNSCDVEIKNCRNKSKNANVRLKYLTTLWSNKATGEGDEEETYEEEKDRICVICRSTIIIGILTSCGHQYCKDCLELWTKKKPSCPMCTNRLTPSDMYSFTFKRSELKGTLFREEDDHHDKDLDSQEGTNSHENMSKISVYKPMKDDVLKEVQEIKIVKEYGTKLDMIVRQVIWLKENDNKVQILIYSQWSDFLRLISIALKQNGINCLGSRDTLANEGGLGRPKQTTKDVENFKKDTNITCFLLNAKAQAAGLTLVNASHVFLCESLVSLPLQLQAISRVHRLGQTKRTTVWMFVIEDTVDEAISIFSNRKRSELLKKVKEQETSEQIEEIVEEDEEEGDNLVDVTELTKTTNRLVDNKIGGGEVVNNDELWASFFSHKSTALG